MEETLGKRIVYHRKRLGMTQDRLAESLGVTAQAVSKWENDQSCPDITTLPKLAEIFGITTDALLGVETSRTAEILPEQQHPDEDRDDLWEVRWDTGRKSGIGFALWVLLVGGLAMANAFDCFGENGPGLWTLCWTCGMLLYGLFGLYRRFRFFRLGCALAGGYFLLNELSIIEIYPQWKFILPGALILLGISLLFDSLRKPAKGSFHIMHGGKPLVNQCSCEDDRFFCTTSFGQNTVPGSFAGCVHPVSIMDCLISVKGKAHQEALLFEKFCPVIVDRKAVGLNGMSDGYLLGAVLRFQRQEGTEEIQTDQGRLAALKGKLNKSAGIHCRKGGPDQGSGCVLGHHSHALYFPDIGDIVVKTIAAPHVAQTGCRLDQKCNRPHMVPPVMVYAHYTAFASKSKSAGHFPSGPEKETGLSWQEGMHGEKQTFRLRCIGR